MVHAEWIQLWKFVGDQGENMLGNDLRSQCQRASVNSQHFP